MNGSNSFGTVDCDAHVITNMVFTVSHVFFFISLRTQQLNILRHICEIERT